jgi:hypothetical protein
MTSTGDSLARDGEVVSLSGGDRVLVRHLLASDREELAERYLELSPEARRLRFFNAPDHLSTRLLDYLLDVDGSTAAPSPHSRSMTTVRRASGSHGTRAATTTRAAPKRR